MVDIGGFDGKIDFDLIGDLFWISRSLHCLSESGQSLPVHFYLDELVAVELEKLHQRRNIPIAIHKPMSQTVRDLQQLEARSRLTERSSRSLL